MTGTAKGRLLVGARKDDGGKSKKKSLSGKKSGPDEEALWRDRKILWKKKRAQNVLHAGGGGNPGYLGPQRWARSTKKCRMKKELDINSRIAMPRGYLGVGSLKK